MKIGFAGLGRMGTPMAAHLAAAGHSVLGYDPALTGADSLSEPLRSNHIHLADTPADLGTADISLSMLPNAAITDTVLFGADGIIPAASTGHIHVVMGTVGPSAVTDFARQASTTGVTIADSPVSGSVSLAETGRLTAIVGADTATFQRLQPVLALMTAKQFHVGAAGAGSAAKVALNTVLAALNQGIAEALVLAQAGGVEPADFYEVLASSAVAAPYVNYKRDNFLDPDGSDVAFTLALLNKDVTLGLALARDHNLHLPQTYTVAQVLDHAVQSGIGQHDMAGVLALLRTHTQGPDTD